MSRLVPLDAGFSLEDKVILHADCNNFFASAESISHPEYKLVPMAVCGDPKSRHGIILAKNQLAKGYGIETAETVYSALKKCPQLLLIPPTMGLYKQVSEKINTIYEEYTDQVERFSIDESFLDVTASRHLFGTGEEIANALRKRVREEIGITISVGVSFNKTFAKLGSDYKKPDATTVISPANYQDILWPLPVEDMLFVGKAGANRLRNHGITTIGELAQSEEEVLISLLGKSGAQLKAAAMGLDDSPVAHVGEHTEPKSIGNGMTFPKDIFTRKEILAGLLLLCDSVGARLRQQKLYASTLQVQIKDPALKVISRQKPLPSPTNSTKVLRDTAMEIVEKAVPSGAPIRLLTVTATQLSHEGEQQLSLFSDGKQEEKQQRLDNALDSIRTRFGKDALQYGRILRKEDAQEESDDLP